MEYQGKTQSNVKIDNQRVMINLLYEKGPLSRADIAKILKSSKPTVSKNAESLLKSKQVLEIGKADNMIGKKAMLLDINTHYGYVLAIDLSKDKVKLAISDLKGKILYYYKAKYDYNLDVVKALDDYLLTHKEAKKSIRQIMISYPGVVGNDDRYYLANIKRNKLFLENILKYVKQTFHKKPIVKNDVNLAVIAEKQYGPYQNIENLYYLSCDVGVGSGIILNHKLYEGDSNAAGEVGLVLAEQKIDGAYHTLEERISIYALENRYKEKTGETITFEQLKERINEGEAVATRLYEDIISNLCITVTMVSSILDIKQVVVAGRLFDLKEDMVSTLNHMIKNMLPFEMTIYKSNIDEAALKGAIYIGIKQIIKDMVG